MFTFILIIIGVLIIGGIVGMCYGCNDDKHNERNSKAIYCTSCVVSVIGIIVVLFVILHIDSIKENPQNYDKTVMQKIMQSYDLISLKSTSEQEGSLHGFGWVIYGNGSGYIDGSSKEESYYKFYTKDSDDEVKQVKVKPDDIIVKITTGKPHYDIIEKTTSYTLKKKYQDMGIHQDMAPDAKTSRILYIPKDSIKQEYSLD